MRRFESFLDEVYAGFKKRVAEGRKLDADAVETVAKGRVWTGEERGRAGLVDAFGGYATALDARQAAAGIPAASDVTMRALPAAERHGARADRPRRWAATRTRIPTTAPQPLPRQWRCCSRWSSSCSSWRRRRTRS